MPRDDGPGAGALTEAEVNDLIWKEYEKLNRYCRGECFRGGVRNPADQDDIFERALELTLLRSRKKDRPWFAIQSDIPRVAGLWQLFKLKIRQALKEHWTLRSGEVLGDAPPEEDQEGDASPELFIEAAKKKHAMEIEQEKDKRWLLEAHAKLPGLLKLHDDPIERFVIMALMTPWDVSEELVNQVANLEPKNQKAKFFQGNPAELWEAVRNLPRGDEEFSARKQRLATALGVLPNTLDKKQSRATAALRSLYEKRAARKDD